MSKNNFRGKSEDGKWHYGNLVVTHHATYIVDMFFLPAVSLPVENFIEVDPKSVGQHIDRKDKDKKEIYEGDIIKRLFSPRRYVVEWNQRTTEFLLRDCYGGWTGVNSSCEVIGNITDKPELLVGE